MSKKKEKLGQCYLESAKFILDAYRSKNDCNRWFLVHGEVFSPTYNEYIGHAWVEINDTVFDSSVGMVGPLEGYYDYGKIKKFRKYTAEEMVDKLLKYGHYGPWEEEDEQANLEV